LWQLGTGYLRFGGIAEVRIFDGKKYEKGSKKYRKTLG
jgi:hypothetical protein